MKSMISCEEKRIMSQVSSLFAKYSYIKKKQQKTKKTKLFVKFVLLSDLCVYENALPIPHALRI